MQNDHAPQPHPDMGAASCEPGRANDRDYRLWEKRVDALMTLLSPRGLLAVDELQREINGLGLTKNEFDVQSLTYRTRTEPRR